MGATINLSEVRENIRHAAYQWAAAEQKRIGCIAQPIRLTFKSDSMDSDKDGYVMSIFYDRNTGKALLRCDWLDEMGVKYDLLTNLEEIKQLAPKSTQHMLENGVKLYRYYDGPVGGITRRMEKAWV